MLKVFICEDDPVQLEETRRYVEGAIATSDYDMEIAVVTGDPDEIIEYLKANRVPGLYLLDYNLGHKIDGITLAKMIREYDSRGFIAFITIHLEIIRLAFTERINAMDFILKDEATNVRMRVEKCIEEANHLYTTKIKETESVFSFSNFNVMHQVYASNIVYLEAIKTSHKVRLYTIDGIYEFFSSFREVKDSLKGNFFRCHQSSIINLNHVKEYDKEKKTVIMDSGAKILVSRKNNRAMQKFVNNSPQGASPLTVYHRNPISGDGVPKKWFLYNAIFSKSNRRR